MRQTAQQAGPAPRGKKPSNKSISSTSYCWKNPPCSAISRFSSCRAGQHAEVLRLALRARAVSGPGESGLSSANGSTAPLSQAWAPICATSHPHVALAPTRCRVPPPGREKGPPAHLARGLGVPVDVDAHALKDAALPRRAAASRNCTWSLAFLFCIYPCSAAAVEGALGI